MLDAKLFRTGLRHPIKNTSQKLKHNNNKQTNKNTPSSDFNPVNKSKVFLTWFWPNSSSSDVFKHYLEQHSHAHGFNQRAWCFWTNMNTVSLVAPAGEVRFCIQFFPWVSFVT